MSFFRRTRLHSAFHAAAAMARDQMVQTCEAHKNVDDALHRRPGAEEHVDDVPIAAGDERAEADEAPVECSDDDEDA